MSYDGASDARGGKASVHDFRDALVVCTRNRPDLIISCLRRVLASNHTPDEIWIIDSSDGPETALAVQDPEFASRIFYCHSKPGLTYQRNVGLANIESSVNIVHFIDDDTLVSADYFSAILASFELHVDAVGLGGFPHETKLPRADRLRSLRRMLQIEGPPGAFSRAAVNSPLEFLPPYDTEVEWLSGCAMSFRAEIAKQVKFDEALLAYGLGEDAEFCLRVGAHGRLLICPAAHMKHLSSPVNRLKARDMVAADVRHRYYFVGKHPWRFGRRSYWVSVIGLSSFGLARLVARGRVDGGVTLEGLSDGLRDIWAARSAPPGSTTPPPART